MSAFIHGQYPLAAEQIRASVVFPVEESHVRFCPEAALSQRGVTGGAVPVQHASSGEGPTHS